jgi:hypothetical protein
MEALREPSGSQNQHVVQWPIRRMVAIVLEVAPRVPGSDRRERPAERFHQGLAGAGFGLAQQPLDYGEGPFTVASWRFQVASPIHALPSPR